MILRDLKSWLAMGLFAACAFAEEPFTKPTFRTTRVPSQVIRVRPARPAPRCVALSADLFQRDTTFLHLDTKAEFRLAGDGDTLGVVTPVAEGSFRLRLFRQRKEVQVFELKSSLFRLSRLFLFDRGDYAVLAFRDAFAVFAGGSLLAEYDDETTRSASVAVVRGDVFWCPRVFPEIPNARWEEGSDEVALCYRASLAGERPEAFFFVDKKKLDARRPFLEEWNVRVVARPDGKLWLLGTASTEVALVSSGGRVLRRGWLPVSLYDRSQDPNPELKAQYEKELEEEEKEAAARAEEQWRSLPPIADATRPPRREVPVTLYRFEPLVHHAARRGRDLVFTAPLPESKTGVFLLRDGTEDVMCWVLPAAVHLGEAASLFASTDDELWFPEPLGYFRWSELEALWDQAFGKGEKMDSSEASRGKQEGNRNSDPPPLPDRR